MNHTTEGTTKRYKGNSSCEYTDFTPKQNALYQYGCEFEFYIPLTPPLQTYDTSSLCNLIDKDQLPV